MIFCFGETNPYDESDFVRTTDGKLFQPLIHHTQEEHWATTGYRVNPATLDGVESYDRVLGIIKLMPIPPPPKDPPMPGTLGEGDEEGKRE